MVVNSGDTKIRVPAFKKQSSSRNIYVNRVKSWYPWEYLETLNKKTQNKLGDVEKEFRKKGCFKEHLNAD